MPVPNVAFFCGPKNFDEHSQEKSWASSRNSAQTPIKGVYTMIQEGLFLSVIWASKTGNLNAACDGKGYSFLSSPDGLKVLHISIF